jgi:hypothetical protein
MNLIKVQAAWNEEQYAGGGRSDVPGISVFRWRSTASSSFAFSGINGLRTEEWARNSKPGRNGLTAGGLDAPWASGRRCIHDRLTA